MTLLLRLPVGPYDSRGEPQRFEEVGGEPVAEGKLAYPEATGEAKEGVLDVRWALIRSNAGAGYILHTVLASRRSSHPLLGRIEHFPTWAALAARHPGVARLVASTSLSGVGFPTPDTARSLSDLMDRDGVSRDELIAD